MSKNVREPERPPRAEDAWAILRTLCERVARSLARGDGYDLLLNASRDAEDLLARHAADHPADRERQVLIEDAPSRKAA